MKIIKQNSDNFIKTVETCLKMVALKNLFILIIVK